jgi:hypothetical protein
VGKPESLRDRARLPPCKGEDEIPRLRRKSQWSEPRRSVIFVYNKADADRHTCVRFFSRWQDEPQGFGYRLLSERSLVRLQPGPPTWAGSSAAERFTIRARHCVRPVLRHRPPQHRCRRLHSNRRAEVRSQHIEHRIKTGGEPRTFGYLSMMNPTVASAFALFRDGRTSPRVSVIVVNRPVVGSSPTRPSMRAGSSVAEQSEIRSRLLRSSRLSKNSWGIRSMAGPKTLKLIAQVRFLAFQFPDSGCFLRFGGGPPLRD